MIRKPSDTLNNQFKNIDSPKMNQIGRKFSSIFEILTSTSYYEGTKYAEFFDELNEDGTSKIYVYDPLEKELQKVVNSHKNEIKYLVGLTGMGKTTLLKNHFKISDRDVKVCKDKIIIYISFYYSNLSYDSPQSSVNHEITKYFSRSIKAIMLENQSMFSNDTLFWEGFYNFISKNKPIILETENILPGKLFLNELSSDLPLERKIEKLNSVCVNDPLEYYSSMFKYVLKEINQPYKIIIIYDDVESKAEKFHKPIIEAARHLHSCFTAIESKIIVLKTIVSLRAYTFRCNIGRQSDARREYIQNDVILKTQAVEIHQIFEKRFLAFEHILKTRENATKTESYDYAKKQIKYVEAQLEKIGSNLIYKLSNYNLSDALIAYCNVLTNLEWIPCKEEEYNGAFVIQAKNYRITTENIIYAIANGNSKNYINDNGYIPNILYNDSDGTTLICLYIIKSLLINKIDQVYGKKYIEGKDILSNIKRVYVNSLDSQLRIEFWEHRINDALKYLYNAGILLRSLYDIEELNDDQIERQYKENFKLYLSPRGKCLFSLLSKNAVLLELYRDDIYTNLINNDKLTYQLSAADIFNYLLDYINECFKVETKNIGDIIPELKKYQEIVGNEFISSVLLEGVAKNIFTYYRTEGELYDQLIRKVTSVCNNMLNYSQEIYKSYNIDYHISDYLRNMIKS